MASNLNSEAGGFALGATGRQPSTSGLGAPGVNWGSTDIRSQQQNPNMTPPTNPDNNLMVQGNREKFYGDTSGEYTTPSYTEQLVKQGMGGQLNDYYEFANNKLNDQFAAMGGGPSGALLRASQNLRANQAHDMMDYTKAADDIHYGRLGAGEAAAGTADMGQLDRLKTAFGAAEGLGSSEAGMTGGFYGNAASSSNPFTMESINAGVQQSTIDPGSKFFGDAMGWAGTAAKSQSGGAGK